MRWIWFAPVVVLIASFPTTALPGGDEASVRDISSRLELFVDHYLIERMEGAGLRLHKPQQAEVAIKMEGYGGYTIVIKDDRTYRMYYSSRTTQDTELDSYVTRYAESIDGIHWAKPELGLFEVKRTQANNVVEKQYLVSGGFSPFLDSHPGVPASERYKALGGMFAQSPKYPGLGGLLAFVSGDGIHWKQLRDNPVINEWHYPHFTDTDLPAVFWSESESQYVCYPRIRMKNRTEFAHEDVFKTGYRWIGRTTSKDFINWTKVVPMEYAPVEEFYHNQTHPYFRAPHIYIALPTRFMGVPLNPGRRALEESEVKKVLADPDNQGKKYESITAKDIVDTASAIVDTVLLTSRGGNRFDRTFPEAFIRPGLDPRNWTNRANYSVLGVVPTGPSEMSIYMLHYGAFRSSQIRRFTLRTDGFISVNAPYAGGEMVTKPFIFSGKELVINYATSAPGGVRVEIQDRFGLPQTGHSLAEATEMIGDQIERVVTWKGSSDVSKLAGKPIRLRFVMKDADLYSIRFR